MGGSSSSPSSQQSSTQNQIGISGDQNLTIGAGATIDIGGQSTGGTGATGAAAMSNGGASSADGGIGGDGESGGGVAVSGSGGGATGGSGGAGGNAGSVGSTTVTITTADVNAIDLASHAVDQNTVLAADALNASVNQSNAVAQVADNSLAAIVQTNAQEVALYQLGLQFANNVANQTLAIAANATTQTTAAQSELLNGTSPLAGTVATVSVPTTASSYNWLVYLSAGAALIYYGYQFVKGKK